MVTGRLKKSGVWCLLFLLRARGVPQGGRPGAFIVVEKGIDLPARRYAGCALKMNEQQYFGGSAQFNQ